jgi:hypothetical protein
VPYPVDAEKHANYKEEQGLPQTHFASPNHTLPNEEIDQPYSESKRYPSNETDAKSEIPHEPL